MRSYFDVYAAYICIFDHSYDLTSSVREHLLYMFFTQQLSLKLVNFYPKLFIFVCFFGNFCHHYHQNYHHNYYCNHHYHHWYFYRTQVNLESDLWVGMSVCLYMMFLKLMLLWLMKLPRQYLLKMPIGQSKAMWQLTDSNLLTSYTV